MLLPIFLILVILLAFLFYPYFYSYNTNNIKLETRRIYDKIEELKKIVTMIVNHVQLERAFVNLGDNSLTRRQKPFLLPSYKIYPSDSITRTENHHDIHLVLWNKENNTLYEDNTLVYATLHEIAHIMVPEAEHGDVEFEDIEEILLKTAVKLGYYNPQLALAPNYSCMME